MRAGRNRKTVLGSRSTTPGEQTPCLIGHSCLVNLVLFSLIVRPQPYDFYCVLDIEATCEEAGDWDYPNEIIEFPVILIDGYSYEVVSEQPFAFPFVSKLTFLGSWENFVNTSDQSSTQSCRNFA